MRMTPNAMAPEVAQTVLAAADIDPLSEADQVAMDKALQGATETEQIAAGKRVAAKVKLTSKSATYIIQSWLRAIGYQRDPWGNYLKPAAPSARWHFKATVVNQQEKRAGEWRNVSSRSLIETAMNLIVNASKALGRSDVEQVARGAREQRTTAAQKRAAKAARAEVEQQAHALAAKAMAWKYRAELDQQLRGGQTTPEMAAQFRADNIEAQQRILAALDAGAPIDQDDAQVASVDQPPLLPLLHDVPYSWVHTQDGVPYTIRVGRHVRGQAAITIGRSTEAALGMGVDPITHRVTWEHHATAVGDGYATGQVLTLDQDRGAKLFLVIAHDKQKGAGSRLLKIWCRLMAGYGVQDWIAEAVGPEGEAFLKALEKRGTIAIDGEHSLESFWMVRCL
jgi:hypothetical protein